VLGRGKGFAGAMCEDGARLETVEQAGGWSALEAKANELPESNMNKIICFTMFTPLLSFYKY
jgi:hypothetical protein